MTDRSAFLLIVEDLSLLSSKPNLTCFAASFSIVAVSLASSSLYLLCSAWISSMRVLLTSGTFSARFIIDGGAFYT